MTPHLLPTWLAQAPSTDTNGLLIVGSSLSSWCRRLADAPQTRAHGRRRPPTSRRRALEARPQNRSARAAAKAPSPLRGASRSAPAAALSGLRPSISMNSRPCLRSKSEAEAAAAEPPPPRPPPGGAAALAAAGPPLKRSARRFETGWSPPEGFVARLGKLFAGKQIDAALIDEIEEVLYRADLGVQATEALLTAIKNALSKSELSDAERVWETLQSECLRMLAKVGTGPLELPAARDPAVLMVIGVNGSGKTTTIGKLAHRYAAEGRKILVAAGDTFAPPPSISSRCGVSAPLWTSTEARTAKIPRASATPPSNAPRLRDTTWSSATQRDDCTPTPT